MTNAQSIINVQKANVQSRTMAEVALGHWNLEPANVRRHSSWVIRHVTVLAAAAFLASAAGCYERKQVAVLNPDGSGKMLVHTMVAVPAQGAAREKLTAVAFGRQVAATLINGTRGVDAWADVEVSEAPGGKARIVGTAYFPDINKLKFDMPIEFVWKRDLDGGTLTVQRTRSAARTAITSESQLKEIVAAAQKQYKDNQQLLWHTQLDVFQLDMTFELPGEVGDVNLFKRDQNKVSLVLDGKKTAEALDKFMADSAALTAMFKAGQDLPANDDIMLQSMYGAKGPVSAKTKLAVDAKPEFDYRLETLTAQVKQSDMLKEAGIELIPRFIVNDPATRSGGSTTRSGAGDR
jgi:hypothetical protein